MHPSLTNLHQKPRKRKRVLPHHHAPPIPNQLAHVTPKHGKQERPRLVFNPQTEMDHEREKEEDDEDHVGGEGGPVLVDADAGGAVCGARGQGAVLVGAVAYEVIGVVVGVCHWGGARGVVRVDDGLGKL